MKRNFKFLLAMFTALTLIVGMSACKKCQTCTIEYSYEFTDTDPQGNPVTVTETGTEMSEEECSSSKNLDDMEAQWQQDEADLKTQLEGQGAQNIVTNLTCTRS